MMNRIAQLIWLVICLAWIVATAMIPLLYICDCNGFILEPVSMVVYRLSGISVLVSFLLPGGSILTFIIQWFAIYFGGRAFIKHWPELSQTKRLLGPGLLLAFFAITIMLNHALLGITQYD